MPLVPRNEKEGVTTRAMAESQQREDAGASSSGGESAVKQSTSTDMNALLQQMTLMLQEQARRQEEQLCVLQENLHKDVITALQRNAERVEAVEKVVEGIKAKFGKYEEAFQGYDLKFVEFEKKVNHLGTSRGCEVFKSGNVFKIPHYDGKSSWAAFKFQFETVKKASGWSNNEAQSALTIALRDEALTVLEALCASDADREISYEELLNALESRYGDKHLEHVYRAQIKDRAQGVSENLQQWSVEIERLVRKAYQSSPSTVETMLLQAFVDGIRDPEVRATVRLKHHTNLKEAVAHALEVEAVRHDSKALKLREVVTAEGIPARRRIFNPTCYECGERGHIRSSCPRRVNGRGLMDTTISTTDQTQKN